MSYFWLGPWKFRTRLRSKVVAMPRPRRLLRAPVQQTGRDVLRNTPRDRPILIQGGGGGVNLGKGTGTGAGNAFGVKRELYKELDKRVPLGFSRPRPEGGVKRDSFRGFNLHSAPQEVQRTGEAAQFVLGYFAQITQGKTRPGFGWNP